MVERSGRQWAHGPMSSVTSPASTPALIDGLLSGEYARLAQMEGVSKIGKPLTRAPIPVYEAQCFCCDLNSIWPWSGGFGGWQWSDGSAPLGRALVCCECAGVLKVAAAGDTRNGWASEPRVALLSIVAGAGRNDAQDAWGKATSVVRSRFFMQSVLPLLRRPQVAGSLKGAPLFQAMMRLRASPCPDGGSGVQRRGVGHSMAARSEDVK